ncbi:MAG: putative phosphatase YcdX [Firmicutes bacterium]|nr:putative phosphatase YcdX [Bacillota bacterium]
MFKADTHMHTISSGHACGTIWEMAKAASSKDLDLIIITDHGPALPGGPHKYYFTTLVWLPPFIEGVEVLRGIEANIIDEHGSLDLEPHFLEMLDWVAVGLHDDCWAPRSRDENTAALLGAIHSGLADVIVHPGNPRFPIHHRAFVEALAAAGMAMEMNNSSLVSPYRRGSEANCQELGALALECGVPIVLGSDAHTPWQVGDVSHAFALATSCGILPEQILNHTADGVRKFLAKRGKKRFATLLG